MATTPLPPSQTIRFVDVCFVSAYYWALWRCDRLKPSKTIVQGLSANVNLVKGDCYDLPAYRYANDNLFLTRWTLTWRERISALFGGSVWLWVRASGHPPVSLSVEPPILSNEE